MGTESAAPIIIHTTPLPENKGILPSQYPKSFPKILFIVLILIIIAELIWGAWYIFRPLQKRINSSPQNSLVTKLPKSTASIKLSSINPSVSVGDKLSVDINLSSKNTPSDGVDIVIKYDPNFLRVEGKNEEVFIKGSVFPEYLGYKVDNKLGVLRISGISEVTSAPAIAQGLFGTVNFKAVNQGTTQVVVDFKPGNTTDSNVIDSKSNKDILDKVSNLSVKIN
ncbi:hypothetical protein HY025_05500 [Candidatus Daviesbacteria bacterium]|nr:hypothetical protein [Candidatus Daviesbacteria bacterium]